MFGVVLWSDTEDRKAVIWCEDHGDLAFYSTAGDAKSLGISLDAGDLVQFEMTTDKHRRLAHNPRLIHEAGYAGLADTLSETLVAPGARGRSAEILPFEPRASKATACSPENEIALSAS